MTGAVPLRDDAGDPWAGRPVQGGGVGLRRLRVPARGELRRRLRWAVARLAGRSRRACWADLVGWAQDGHREYPLRGCFTAAECKAGEDFDHAGACWCGKFRAPGGAR